MPRDRAIKVKKVKAKESIWSKAYKKMKASNVGLGKSLGETFKKVKQQGGVYGKKKDGSD